MAARFFGRGTPRFQAFERIALAVVVGIDGQLHITVEHFQQIFQITRRPFRRRAHIIDVHSPMFGRSGHKLKRAARAYGRNRSGIAARFLHFQSRQQVFRQTVPLLQFGVAVAVRVPQHPLPRAAAP